MRYFAIHSRSLLQIALAVLAGWLLTSRIGAWQTLLMLALLASVAAGLGAFLLKSSELGQITWKNRVAGCLVPWGWKFAKGMLWRGVTASGIVWVLFGSVGVLLATSPVAMPVTTGPSATVSTALTALLAIAWIVDGGAVLYFVSTLVKNHSPGSRPAASILKVLCFALAILIASVVLHLMGHPYLALAVAGIPPLAVGTFFGLFVLAILLAGKNLRWN